MLYWYPHLAMRDPSIRLQRQHRGNSHNEIGDPSIMNQCKVQAGSASILDQNRRHFTNEALIASGQEKTELETYVVVCISKIIAWVSIQICTYANCPTPLRIIYERERLLIVDM